MRRRRVPAAVSQLAGGEKPLAWASVDGDWIVATRGWIRLPGAEPLAWEEVIRAAWDAPVLEMQVPQTTVRLVLDDPGGIPEIVNERVKASVVMQQHVALVGDLGVRLVARRRPGSTDIVWRVTFDAGLDANDPQIRDAAEQALAELRASIGL